METYKEFIRNILDTRGRFNCGDEYHECHHITPRSIGGGDDKENLIDLYAREHFEAHRLLALENPNNYKLIYAWWNMSHMNKAGQRNYEITADEYEEARIAASKAQKEKSSIPENHPRYGKHHSEETKKKISESNKGKIVSDESREKMSRAQKGKTYSDEYKQNMSEVLTGRIISEATRKKLSEVLTGREFSDDHRSNLSEAMKKVWENEEYRESRSGENHPFFGDGKKNPMYGKHHSDEARQKISEAAKERFSNPENCPNYGKEMSEETKQKLREAQERYWTEERKRALSEERKGTCIGKDNPNFGNHKLAGAANPRAIKVIRLLDKKIYDYIGQAAEDNNMHRETMVLRCKKHKDFMFYDEYLTQLAQ